MKNENRSSFKNLAKMGEISLSWDFTRNWENEKKIGTIKIWDHATSHYWEHFQSKFFQTRTVELDFLDQIQIHVKFSWKFLTKTLILFKNAKTIQVSQVSNQEWIQIEWSTQKEASATGQKPQIIANISAQNCTIFKNKEFISCQEARGAKKTVANLQIFHEKIPRHVENFERLFQFSTPPSPRSCQKILQILALQRFQKGNSFNPLLKTKSAAHASRQASVFWTTPGSNQIQKFDVKFRTLPRLTSVGHGHFDRNRNIYFWLHQKAKSTGKSNTFRLLYVASFFAQLLHIQFSLSSQTLTWSKVRKVCSNFEAKKRNVFSFTIFIQF